MLKVNCWLETVRKFCFDFNISLVCFQISFVFLSVSLATISILRVFAFPLFVAHKAPFAFVSNISTNHEYYPLAVSVVGVLSAHLCVLVWCCTVWVKLCRNLMLNVDLSLSSLSLLRTVKLGGVLVGKLSISPATHHASLPQIKTEYTFFYGCPKFWF